MLVVALLALAAGRAVTGHSPYAGPITATAAACAVIYAAGPALPRVRRSRRAAALWLAAVGACWLVLMALSGDGVWVAFPLYFLQLHLLPRRAGLAAVAATAVAAVAGFAAHQGSFSPAMAIGPALGAAVAVAVVWGYQALYRESEQRRRLIEELTATRADLAAAQHAAGVLDERERLAREIHACPGHRRTPPATWTRHGRPPWTTSPRPAVSSPPSPRPPWRAPPSPAPWSVCAPPPAPDTGSPHASTSPANPCPSPPRTRSRCCASPSPR